MDAITLLKQDHREVEALFKRFEAAGDGALKLKRKLVDQIIAALSKHASIEEAILYPAARAALEETSDGEDMVLEALEEHHVVKWTLEELITLAPDAERFEAKATVLMESVRHHVKEEEQDLFPKLRKVMSRDELIAIGDAMAQAKKVAPTRPHPRSPDAPPGNLVSTPVAALMDRSVEMVKDVVARGKRKLTGDGEGKNVH
jgi:hemerythrin superfamily protein